MSEDDERRESAQHEKPNRDELLALLHRAHDALEASEHHWQAVPHLTGDRRYQRQQQEALKLLRAMRTRILSS